MSSSWWKTLRRSRTRHGSIMVVFCLSMTATTFNMLKVSSSRLTDVQESMRADNLTWTHFHMGIPALPASPAVAGTTEKITNTTKTTTSTTTSRALAAANSFVEAMKKADASAKKRIGVAGKKLASILQVLELLQEQRYDEHAGGRFSAVLHSMNEDLKTIETILETATKPEYDKERQQKAPRLRKTPTGAKSPLVENPRKSQAIQATRHQRKTTLTPDKSGVKEEQKQSKINKKQRRPKPTKEKPKIDSSSLNNIKRQLNAADPPRGKDSGRTSRSSQERQKESNIQNEQKGQDQRKEGVVAPFSYIDLNSTVPSSGYMNNNLWDNSTTLPNWLKEYFAWHAQERSRLNESNWHTARYLIPTARRGYKSGGMTDRIRPIPAFLRLAAQTKRLLLIYWERPFALEEFLLPPQGGLDWRVPSYMVPAVTKHPPRTDWVAVVKEAQEETPTVVTVRYQSWNYGEQWYMLQAEENETPVRTAFRDIWKVVFTPSPPVAQRIRDNFDRMQLTPGEFATAHIRALYAVQDRKKREVEKIAMNAMNCVSNLRPGGPFFIASDSSHAVQTAISYGASKNVTVVAADHPKQPLHVDFHNESDTSVTPADFYDGFVDLYLMAATRCAAVGPGGFARWGHLLGYNETCVIHHHGRKSHTCEWHQGVSSKASPRQSPVSGHGHGMNTDSLGVDVRMQALPKFYAPVAHTLTDTAVL